MEQYDEQRLIDMYHQALTNKDDEQIIATSLSLAQFYYQENQIEKANHHLQQINKKDTSIENLHLYLGLIALHNNNLENAKKELKKELKHHPKNIYAKKVLDKITISTNFPYATLFISFLFIGIFAFFYPEMNFSQTLLYGLSLQHSTLFSAITSIFTHVNIFHLVLNTLLFLSLGSLVERHIGSLQFSLFFLFSGLIANYSQILIGTADTIVIGASGALFGIMGVLLMQQPLLKLRLFGLIKIPVIILYGTIFSLSLLFTQYLFGSAEIAHLFGLFTGILYAGVMYHETITVFYHWILITFGFYFIILLPQNILLNSTTIENLITSSIFFLVGVFMIFYSYMKLKIVSKSIPIGGGEEDE